MQQLKLEPFECVTANGTRGTGYTAIVYRNLQLRIVSYEETHRVVASIVYRGQDFAYTAFESANTVRGVCFQRLIMSGAYKVVGQRFMQGKAGSSVEEGLKIFDTVKIASQYASTHSAELAKITRQLATKVEKPSSLHK